VLYALLLDIDVLRVLERQRIERYGLLYAGLPPIRAIELEPERLMPIMMPRAMCHAPRDADNYAAWRLRQDIATITPGYHHLSIRPVNRSRYAIATSYCCC